MPGFDGTGPRGLGPMTGGGGGLCILKLPAEQDKPVSGLAGRTGWTIGRPSRPDVELAILQAQSRRLEAVIRAIHGRIQSLQALEKNVGV